MYNAFTLIFLVARLWQGEDIPHPIPDNIITVFILVGLDEDLQISIYRNFIKPNIYCIIFTYLLFITILFKGMHLGLDIMYRISPVLEILFFHIPRNNPTILLIKPCQKFIFSYMSVIYQVNMYQYSLLNIPPHRGAYTSYPDPSIFLAISQTPRFVCIQIYRYGFFCFSLWISNLYPFRLFCILLIKENTSKLTLSQRQPIFQILINITLALKLSLQKV